MQKALQNALGVLGLVLLTSGAALAQTSGGSSASGGASSSTGSAQSGATGTSSHVSPPEGQAGTGRMQLGQAPVGARQPTQNDIPSSDSRPRRGANAPLAGDDARMGPDELKKGLPQVCIGCGR